MTKVEQVQAPYDYESEERKSKRLVNTLLGVGSVAAFALIPVGMAIGLSDTESLHESLRDREAAAGEDLVRIAGMLDMPIDQVASDDLDVYCILPPGEETFEAEGKVYETAGSFVDDSFLPKPSIFIRPEICRSLNEYRQASLAGEVSHEVLINGLFAVYVAAHEIAHSEGELDEGLANCAAVELIPQVASATYAPELINLTSNRGFVLRFVQDLDQPREYHDDGC